MSSWIDQLNPAQREAVTAGNGPLLIVAGAGTGKTRTLACRVAYLIEQGVSPDRILLLTFTRRAAAEMIRRAGQLIGAPDGSGAGSVWGGTFHAVANRLLRVHGRAAGLADEFTILDQSDAGDLMNLIRNELDVAKGDRRFARKHTLVSIHSRMVNAQEPLSITLETHFPWCAGDVDNIRSIFEQYAIRKKEQGLLDYDDLLLFWSALTVTAPVSDVIARQFDHILVDEYQDTNPIQAEILLRMRRSCDNLCVVGDDAQSIYSFRAATIRNILDFPEQFPGTHIVTLEQNYRSTSPILTAANAVMDRAGERYTKSLWSQRESDQKPILVTCVDETEQCDSVCSHILDHLEQGVSLMQQAVLFRASHHSAQLEIELGRRNIPFHKYGGLKFVEASHIKDMLAVLRILENPQDEISWFRILQLLEGIGPRTARRIMNELNVRPVRANSASGREETTEADSPLRSLLDRAPHVAPAAREQLDRLRHVLADCCGQPPAKELPLSTQVERVREFYQPIFARIYDNAPMRLRDLEQLGHIAAGYRSRTRFLSDVTLDPPESTADLAGPPFLEEDYLTLSTIHSAKGCEWTAVHIIHAADGMIPSDMATRDEAGVDEERRLFYVAMTRAKDNLYVYFPLRYYHKKHSRGDAHTYAQLTRYLPQDICALFDRQTASKDSTTDEEASIKADPYGRVSRLWEQ